MLVPGAIRGDEPRVDIPELSIVGAGASPAIDAGPPERLADLTPAVIRDADRQALRRQAEVIRRTADRELRDAANRRYVEARYRHAVAGLG